MYETILGMFSILNNIFIYIKLKELTRFWFFYYSYLNIYIILKTTVSFPSTIEVFILNDRLLL